MSEKLHWKQHTNAQALLNSIYEEVKVSNLLLSDAEIAECVQFMWYNIDSKKYEIIYYKTV
jgi:hypothetical protein